MKPRSEFIKFLYDSMGVHSLLSEELSQGVHPDDHGLIVGRIRELETTIQYMFELIEIDDSIAREDVWKLYLDACDAEDTERVVHMPVSPLNIC